MKGSTGCDLCVERDTQDILCKYTNPVCSLSNMQIQSASFPVQPHPVNSSSKYLPGDGEVKPKRTLSLTLGYLNPANPLDPEHSVVFFFLCFYLETERMRLAVVLRRDSLSFSYRFWIPFPVPVHTLGQMAQPNGFGSRSQLDY